MQIACRDSFMIKLTVFELLSCSSFGSYLFFWPLSQEELVIVLKLLERKGFFSWEKETVKNKLLSNLSKKPSGNPEENFGAAESLRKNPHEFSMKVLGTRVTPQWNFAIYDLQPNPLPRRRIS